MRCGFCVADFIHTKINIAVSSQVEVTLQMKLVVAVTFRLIDERWPPLLNKI